MKKGVPEREHLHEDDLKPTTTEKRKEPEGGSSNGSESFSMSTKSGSSSGKKVNHNYGNAHLSDGISSSVPAGPSSTASQAPIIAEEVPIQSEAPANKSRSKCPYCPKVLTRTHDLRYHVEKRHQRGQEILCHMCNFRATDIITYLAHENDHLCKCEFCGFVAKNYRGLPRHKKFCSKNPANQGETA